MASYQQIDVRLRTLEDMVTFLMTATRMRTMLEKDIPGPGGETVRTQVPVEGTLMDFYLAAKGSGMSMNQSDGIGLAEVPTGAEAGAQEA